MKNFTISTGQVLLSLFLLVFSTFLAITDFKLFLIWFITLLIGFTLYRSGICFCSSYYDAIFFKNYKVTRALIITTIISLIGVTLIHHTEIAHGQFIHGRIAPVGFHTMVGSFLFGLGMIIAGACPSGTIQKMAEGSVLFIAVLVAIIFGSVIGIYNFSWWQSTYPSFDPILFPNLFGLSTSFIVSLSVLIVAFFLTFIAEKKSFPQVKGWLKWLKKR